MSNLRALAALLVVAFAAAPARAASLESARSMAQSSFDAALVKPLELPKKPKGSYVSVSGSLTLNGSGLVSGGGGNGRMPTGGWASVSLNGWLTVQDAAGRVRSNSTWVDGWVNVFVDGPGVFTYVQADVPVQLYRDGRLVGSGRVLGSIPVSGMASGSWVTLTGTGTLSGSVFIEDAK